MKKRISKVLVMIIMFSLIASLIPMNQTNVSCAATYLGKFNAEEFETITTINKDLEGDISLEQAMKIAKSVYSDLYYFHDSNFERSNGERYYVINIKDKVENHYTSLTQLFISFDGEICVEGYTSEQKIYVYNGDNILDKIKILQGYSKILLQEYNLNEEQDDLKTHFSICDFNADGIQDLILSKEEHILSEKQYYTFENGKVVEIEGPGGDEAYPVYGSLYSLPSRGTYAFYRGGPASEDNNGNGYMPHTIMEYKLENHKINLINDLYWAEYQFGDKAGLNEYYLNGKKCTAEDYQIIYNSFSNQIEFYPNSEINRMYWGVNNSGDIGNEEGKRQKSIAVFTTEKSMGIKTGKSMWMGFGLLDENSGLLDDKWRKMSVVVSDPTVITLSDYTETEYGYSLEVIGKKQGATNITITDTESGISTIVTVFVQDDFAKTYSYAINDMASFYPNNDFEKNIETNIYNLNGLYVNKYQCAKSANSYNISFDVYNSKYYSGAVDIYDENGMWMGYEEIDKYSDISSFWDTREQAYFLVSDTNTGKMLTYEQASFSKYTHIDIEVPEGGYFTISNNISESPGTFFINAFEILFEGSYTIFDLFTSGGTKESALSGFKKEAKKSFATRLIEARNEGLKNNIKRQSQKIMLDSMKSKIKQITKENIKTGLKDKLTSTDTMCANIANLAEDMLAPQSFNIEWKPIFESATGIGESFFTKFAGPAGIALEGCFALNDATNKILMAKQMAESAGNPYVTIFSSVDAGYINQYGVMVNTNGNMDAESVLQVFRVSDSDAIEVLLDSSNPLELHELYNICFVKDDTLVQPNGKVMVQIPIPQGMKGNTCKVYRQEANGNWTILDAKVQGNYLVFETDHFSLYALIGEGDNLAISSLPYKTSYKEGETLDTNGLTLDLNGQLITEGYICEPTVLSGNGKQFVKVIYGHSATKFEVNVEKSISTNKPDNQPTETSKPNQSTVFPTESPTLSETVTIGTKTTVGKMKYNVTKVNNNGTGEVTLIGATRKKSDKRFTSLKVGNTVKIKGKSFQITAIRSNAFRGYKKLKSVTVGKNVKKIGTKAFYGCKKLKKIVIKTKQLQAKKVGNKAFKGIYSKVNIKVPKLKLNSYKKILRAKGVGKRAKIHT